MSQNVPPDSSQSRLPPSLQPGPAPRPRVPMPYRPGRGEFYGIWVQTIFLGMICAGCLVMYHKIVDPKALNERLAPLFANLFGATLLVGLIQTIRQKSWPWPAVGLVILGLASLGLWMTLRLVELVAPQQ